MDHENAYQEISICRIGCGSVGYGCPTCAVDEILEYIDFKDRSRDFQLDSMAQYEYGQDYNQLDMERQLDLIDRLNDIMSERLNIKSLGLASRLWVVFCKCLARRSPSESS